MATNNSYRVAFCRGKAKVLLGCDPEDRTKEHMPTVLNGAAARRGDTTGANSTGTTSSNLVPNSTESRWDHEPEATRKTYLEVPLVPASLWHWIAFAFDVHGETADTETGLAQAKREDGDRRAC